MAKHPGEWCTERTLPKRDEHRTNTDDERVLRLEAAVVEGENTLTGHVTTPEKKEKEVTAHARQTSLSPTNTRFCFLFLLTNEVPELWRPFFPQRV